MCYSLTASLATGSLAYTAVVICWIRNATYRDRWNAIWLLFLGNMQWYDAYIWYMHDSGEDLRTCSYNNLMVTRAAITTIALEPIGNLFAYMYSAKKWLGFKIVLFYMFCFCFIPWTSRMYFSGLIDPMCSLNTNHLCSILTSNNHILYAIAHDSFGSFKCWRKYHFFGELQEEMPLILRVMFLIGIIYPYRYSKPLMPGLINAFIITISWFLGYYSDAHASVWCWAASLQSIYFIFFDSYLFRSPNGYNYNRKEKQFEYHDIDIKEGILFVGCLCALTAVSQFRI